jgi:hypothetical protein
MSVAITIQPAEVRQKALAVLLVGSELEGDEFIEITLFPIAPVD